MQFQKIIGQENIKRRLITQVRENRVSHALMFLGQEGYGGLPLAIAFAQYINCENKSATDACGSCASCMKFEKLIHPDLHFVYPVNTTKSITKDPVSDDFISEWRELNKSTLYFKLTTWYDFIGIENKQGNISKNESASILKKLGLKTFEAEYKTMIIWMPEKMNQACANKLLKILEEPPEKSLFILVAENSGQILPTILSRTQIIKIPRIENASLAAKLTADFSLTDDKATRIAQAAEGNYLNALDMLESNEELTQYLEYFTSLMRLSYKNNLAGLLSWAEELSVLNREKQKSFLSYASKLTRENLVMNIDEPTLVHMNADEYHFSEKFHPFINGTNILAVYNILNKAQEHIEQNANAKIVFTDSALKLMKYIKK